MPILEYHVLGPALEDAPYPELYVSRPDFHRQMNWLDENGFGAVTLETVQDAWYRRGTLPATLGAAELEEEVAGSRKMLQSEYGVPVKNFCYPADQLDSTVIAAGEAAGYAGATTEIPSYAERDGPYQLARFEILGSTGVGGLVADLG